MFSSDLCLHEHIHAHVDRNQTPQTKIGSNNKAGGKKGEKIILPHNFRGFIQHQLGPLLWACHRQNITLAQAKAAMKQRGKGEAGRGKVYTIQGIVYF